MMNYIDCLPEEIIQHIWKFIYNDSLKEIPMCAYANKRDYFVNRGGPFSEFIDTDIKLLRITKEVIKKTGHYYNILKEKYNVVLFHRKYFRDMDEIWEYFEILKHRNHSFLTQSILFYHDTGGEKMWCNLLRNGKYKWKISSSDNPKSFVKFFTKENLLKMLEINGYVESIYHRQTKKRPYYKSWTKDRIIKELMSL